MFVTNLEIMRTGFEGDISIVKLKNLDFLDADDNTFPGETDNIGSCSYYEVIRDTKRKKILFVFPYIKGREFDPL